MQQVPLLPCVATRLREKKSCLSRGRSVTTASLWRFYLCKRRSRYGEGGSQMADEKRRKRSRILREGGSQPGSGSGERVVGCRREEGALAVVQRDPRDSGQRSIRQILRSRRPDCGWGRCGCCRRAAAVPFRPGGAESRGPSRTTHRRHFQAAQRRRPVGQEAGDEEAGPPQHRHQTRGFDQEDGWRAPNGLPGSAPEP